MVKSGMVHKIADGLFLVAVDKGNGGIKIGGEIPKYWNNWVNVYPTDCCKQYAEE
jgi:hypothetical protein